ncbi:MAG TPA: hypothetical protein VJ965_04820 [Anaerolineales bacterium]|nr:hypothetical protein [Anaerolineales bacterium]
MNDGKKTCLGFAFLFMGLLLAVVSILVGGVGEMVKFFGGDTQVGFKFGLYLAIGVFALLFIAAFVMFVSIRDWSWIPAILGGVYAVLPDLIIGPEDDLAAVLIGALLSGLLNYLTGRRKKASPPSRPEKLEPPSA